MAIVNLGTINKLPQAQLPSGYALPVVSEFSDFEYTRKITLSVLKSTVETATASTTMAAIFNNATVGINKQIADIIALDYLGTATVTTYAMLTSLNTNVSQADTLNQTYLLNTPVSYVCTVVLYVKAL